MTLASSTDYGKDENAADKLLAKNKVLETDIQTYQTIVNGVGKESQRLFKTGCQDPQSLRKAQVITVKPVLSGHSKRRPKIGFHDRYHLMQVKSIAEYSKGSILQFF